MQAVACPGEAQRPLDSPSAGLLHGAAPHELARAFWELLPLCPRLAGPVCLVQPMERAQAPRALRGIWGEESPSRAGWLRAASAKCQIHPGRPSRVPPPATERCARRSRGPEGRLRLAGMRGFPRRRRLPSSPASSGQGHPWSPGPGVGGHVH